MEIRKKCISFDMDTHKMEQEYYKSAWRNGYADIGKFLKGYGFVCHRQGSLYETDKIMSDRQALKIVDKLCDKYPWFAESVRDVEIYDKCKKVSVTPILKKHRKMLEKNREKLQKEAIEKFKANKAPENSAKSTDKER